MSVHWKIVPTIELLLSVARSATPQAVSELSAAQRMRLDSTGQVSIVTAVDTAPWPRTCVYQYIASTPEDAAAVFNDYERQTSYIPSLRKAKIARVIDARTLEVDYTLDVPIVADEEYTVRDQLSRDSDSYRVDWSLVRASSSKAIEGNARFQPYRRERSDSLGTLLAYCNFVIPGSRLARFGFIRSRAINQVAATARAIAAQVERERSREPALLEAQLGALRAALRP